MKLLILGASSIQLPIIIRAKELNHFTIVADYDPDAIGFGYADEKLLISTNDIPSLLIAAEEYQIDGVLTTSDYPVRSVAHICEKLGLTGPKIGSAHLCTNKFLLRQHLSNYGFNVPDYRIIKSKESLKSINYYPVIIKPIDSSGSRGVQKANNYEELLISFDSSIHYSKSGELIVEEFIEGPEYSVETLTQKEKTTIVAITEKTVAGDSAKYFVEERHVIQANLSNEQTCEIIKLVTKVIETINLGDCPTHTELKITKNGIYIIEIGARLGGDYITSDLVPLATGVDMLECTINLALNKKINVKSTLNKYSGIQFITNENYNRVIAFLQKGNPIVIKKIIDPYKNVPLTNSFDRLGYFIVQAENREQLLKTLNCKN